MKSKAVKSLTSLFLTLALVFTTGVIAFASNNSWNVGENEGNNVVAYIKDHTLYIEGNGRMDSYATENLDAETKSSVYKVVISYGVTNVGDYAFEDFTNLENVYIPVGVREIGRGAFSGCRALQAIDLPPTVEKIGNNAFEDCDKIMSIQLPASLKEISDKAFNRCYGLKYITLNSMPKISQYAFSMLYATVFVPSSCFDETFDTSELNSNPIYKFGGDSISYIVF